MQPAYTLIRGLEEFTAAREQFAALVNELQSNQVLRMEHGEVEELITHEGMEYCDGCCKGIWICVR
jgi:hypothetical protein